VHANWLLLVGTTFDHGVVATTCGSHDRLVSRGMETSQPCMWVLNNCWAFWHPLWCNCLTHFFDIVFKHHYLIMYGSTFLMNNILRARVIQMLVGLIILNMNAVQLFGTIPFEVVFEYMSVHFGLFNIQAKLGWHNLWQICLAGIHLHGNQ
jgi:hypothetical protein